MVAGDTVDSDDPLLEVSTDKVDSEIPSPFSGVLLEIMVPEGETVEVGAELARIGAAAESGGAKPDGQAPDANLTSAPPSVAPAPAAVPAGDGVRALLSPIVRQLAIEHGIDLGRSRERAPQGGSCERTSRPPSQGLPCPSQPPRRHRLRP